jgi:hypothetical protein
LKGGRRRSPIPPTISRRFPNPSVQSPARQGAVKRDLITDRQVQNHFMPNLPTVRFEKKRAHIGAFVRARPSRCDCPRPAADSGGRTSTASSCRPILRDLLVRNRATASRAEMVSARPFWGAAIRYGSTPGAKRKVLWGLSLSSDVDLVVTRWKV